MAQFRAVATPATPSHLQASGPACAAGPSRSTAARSARAVRVQNIVDTPGISICVLPSAYLVLSHCGRSSTCAGVCSGDAWTHRKLRRVPRSVSCQTHRFLVVLGHRALLPRPECWSTAAPPCASGASIAGGPFWAAGALRLSGAWVLPSSRIRLMTQERKLNSEVAAAREASASSSRQGKRRSQKPAGRRRSPRRQPSSCWRSRRPGPRRPHKRGPRVRRPRPRH